MSLVSPSLLSADFGHLADDCIMLNESQADFAHVDVMDGLFVPNIFIWHTSNQGDGQALQEAT